MPYRKKLLYSFFVLVILSIVHYDQQHKHDVCRPPQGN